MSSHQSSSGEHIATTSVAAESAINESAPVGFFAIGIAVNLALVAAYFIWAFRNWKKTGQNDRS